MHDQNDTFKVVVNDECQYSIWPAANKVPLGWHDVEKAGSREDCLAYIKDVWTDMRPLSLRRLMESGSHTTGTKR
jgi:MbtH protein